MTVATRPAPPRSMAAADRVTQYAMDVLDGKYVVGDKVLRACRRHINDLARTDIIWDVAEAEHSIAFFPAALRHWKGQLGPRPGHPLGDPVTLEPWQEFIVGSAFGWKKYSEEHERWIRRFKKIYVEIGKKNGKTLMAAGFGLRLAFFDSEPGADVYAAATKRDQAKLVWNDAMRAVKANPDLRAFGIVISQATSNLAHPASGSKFEPLGKDSDTDQGINVHAALIDELHVHKDRELFDNVETATSSRVQPMIVIITTAGVRQNGGLWWDERSDAIAILEGRAEDDTVFAYIATLDPDDDPWDEANWIKANPNLGVSINLSTLREQAEAAKRTPGKQAAFFRFRLNLPTSSSVKALSMEEWDKEGNARPPEPQRGWGCYGGLDLASIYDLTALILLFRDEHGDYHVLCRFYCPEAGVDKRTKEDGVPYRAWADAGYLTITPGDVTDYAFIEKDLEEFAEQYEIGEIAYDRWNATQLVTNLTQQGANCVPITQTYGHLSAPWKELERLVLEGRLRHGANPVLRWMAGNVELETDPYGNVKPSKKVSNERIDGMVAVDMALGRWMVWGEEPVAGRSV